MITEKDIKKAYSILREKDQTIPSETLQFILDASLEKLNSPEPPQQSEKMVQLTGDLRELMMKCIDYGLSKCGVSTSTQDNRFIDRLMLSVSLPTVEVSEEEINAIAEEWVKNTIDNVGRHGIEYTRYQLAFGFFADKMRSQQNTIDVVGLLDLFGRWLSENRWEPQNKVGRWIQRSNNPKLPLLHSYAVIGELRVKFMESTLYKEHMKNQKV